MKRRNSGKISTVILIIVAFVVNNCSLNTKKEDGFLCYYSDETIVLDIHNGSDVSDEVIKELFHKGYLDSILTFDVKNMSRDGRAIYSVALIEKDIRSFEKNVKYLLPSICNLELLLENTHDLDWLDKNLNKFNVYQKFALYNYYLQNPIPFERHVGFFFMRRLKDENVDNDPIIHEKALFLYVMLSSTKSYNQIVQDFEIYNDSLRKVYPENVELYFNRAKVFEKIDHPMKVVETLEEYLQFNKDTVNYNDLREALGLAKQTE